MHGKPATRVGMASVRLGSAQVLRPGVLLRANVTLHDGEVVFKEKIQICSLVVDPGLQLLHTVNLFSVYLFWHNASTSWLELREVEFIITKGLT